MPANWDSNVTILFLIEALLAGVQDMRWEITQGRMKRPEELYARTRFFRRYK